MCFHGDFTTRRGDSQDLQAQIVLDREFVNSCVCCERVSFIPLGTAPGALPLLGGGGIGWASLGIAVLRDFPESFWASAIALLLQQQGTTTVVNSIWCCLSLFVLRGTQRRAVSFLLCFLCLRPVRFSWVVFKLRPLRILVSSALVPASRGLQVWFVFSFP